MDESLMKPTRDLSEARQNLDQFGFCMIAEALNPQQTALLRKRLIEQAEAEAKLGQGSFDGGAEMPNQRVWNLINKGKVFRDLIMHPLVGEMMTYLLGANFILSSLSANIAGPGGEPMILHRDQGYMPFHTPLPVVANIAWMLDDVSATNGGTRLVPRSHLSPEPLADPSDINQTVAAEGSAGCALVFDGRVFHGTGPNSTSKKRHVLLSYFARFFMRQQENMFLSLDPRLETELSEDLKARLGYKVCGTLGGVEGPVEARVVQRPGQTLGEITSSTARAGASHNAVRS